MAVIEVLAPFEFFTDLNGNALEAGKIFVGEFGLDPKTNPVPIFSDVDLTIPLAQPVRTIAGVPDGNGTPIEIFTEISYSVQVDDKNDTLVYANLFSTIGIGADILLTFEVVADMIAAQLQVGVTVETLGYFVIGDGGSNTYSIVDAGTGVDDGGSFIDLTIHQAQGRFPKDFITVAQWGLLNVANISAALAFSDKITIPKAVYEDYDFVSSNKIVNFTGNPTFRLPDNTSGGADTVPFASLEISGNNNVFYGDVSVDGNSANNSSVSTDLSFRKGSFAMQGNDNTFHDDVYILDAYYVGYSVGADDTTVCNNFDHQGKVDITSAVNWAVGIWSTDNCRIKEIFSRDTVQALDNRVRTGTQLISDKTCNRTWIGRIVGVGLIGVFEINSQYLHIEFMDLCGWKIEDNDGFTSGNSICRGTTIDNPAFNIISCTNFQIGSVACYDYAGATSVVAIIQGGFQGYIESITVIGTTTTATDFTIQSAQDLIIDNIHCSGSVVDNTGFRFDFSTPAFDPQERIIIGTIQSIGHTVGLDIEVQNYETLTDPTDIIIGSINPDATTNAPSLINQTTYKEGSITATLVPSGGGSITLNQAVLHWTRIGRLVTIIGRLRIDNVSSPLGTTELTNLPFIVTDLSGIVQSAGTILAGGLIPGTLGSVYGQAVEGGTVMQLLFSADGGTTDVTLSLQGNSTFVITMTYITTDGV